MIENNIPQAELNNPLNEHLFYIHNIKNKLIETQEAFNQLYAYYQHNKEFASYINRLSWKLEDVDRDLNELFALN